MADLADHRDRQGNLVWNTYLPTKGRCRAEVRKRDTYRYTGRTKSGFELLYTRVQCGRKAGESGYCWQHVPQEGQP